MPAIDANTLLEEAKCYTCLGISLADALALALLNRIATGGEVGYSAYRATLTQVGANAPVATVMENSLPGTPVWSRVSQGGFNLTLAGAFPAGKVWCNMQSMKTVDGPPQFVYPTIDRLSDDVVQLLIPTNLGAVGDDQLIDTPVEILVYP